jgi:uncharacterized protein YceH (UPF0502 family)
MDQYLKELDRMAGRPIYGDLREEIAELKAAAVKSKKALAAERAKSKDAEAKLKDTEAEYARLKARIDRLKVAPKAAGRPTGGRGR